MDHAVIVRFAPVPRNLEELYSVEDQLHEALKRTGAGEYDGNELAIDGNDGLIYLYGEDADQVFAIAEPILRAAPFLRGAVATKRYGPPGEGVRSESIVLGP